LALGVLITPEAELLEALFGDIEKINLIEGTLTIALSLLIIVVTGLISKRMILGVISEELAESAGIAVSKLNLVYLFLVGMVVALGIRFVGTLLMGALVIVPAVSSKNVAGSIKDYYFYSIFFGVLSTAIGIVLTTMFHFSSGPMIVLTSVIIFIVTFFARREVRAPCK